MSSHGGQDALPALGVRGWVRFVWRRLTSMQVALALLLLLAVAALPGAAFPQRNIDPAGVSRYIADRPTVGPWLDRLGFFAVYSSPWFSAVYLLLFISLVGCIVPRVLVYTRGVRAQPAAAPARLERLATHRVVAADGGADAYLDDAAARLRRARYRVRRDANWVSAEVGYTREAGNLLFHVALVGVLVSMAVSYLFHYQGQKLLPVGETFVHSTVGYDQFSPGSMVDSASLPPFTVTLDDLQTAFDDSAGAGQFAAPRMFDSTVTITEASGNTRTVPLTVNNPVHVDGADLFMVGNGYAPEVTVTDGNGDVAFTGPVPMLVQDGLYTSTGVIKAPDAAPTQFGLQAIFLPTAAEGRDGLQSVFPALDNPELVFSLLKGDLGLDSGAPQSIFELDIRKLEVVTVVDDDGDEMPFRARLRPGDVIELPDGLGTVTFEGVRRYMGLQVRRDPGAIPVLVTSVLATAGLMMSLFVRRRRIFVRVSDAQATWAGLAPVQDPQLPAVVDRFARPDQTANVTAVPSSR